MPRRAITIAILLLSAVPMDLWAQGDSGGIAPRTDPVNGGDAELFELAETVAQVGDQYILRGELLGDANLILSSPFAQLDKVPPADRERAEQELLEYRRQLMEKQLLGQAIERKLKYLEFLRSLPVESDAKKSDERKNRIRDQAGRAFRENLESMVGKLMKASPEEYGEIARQSPQLFRLALVMKDAGIASVEDPSLDRLLKAHGTTLERQQQAYTEQLLGQSAIHHKLNLNPDIPHAQLIAYYREHEDEYHVPTRAQWEQLTVLFQRFPDEQSAWQAIVAMGNEVYLGGAPFWAIAQRKSQEKNASKGGFHDWTEYGNLQVSKPINDAVFTYELNRLSPIIRDSTGFHIIRVLNREEAHVKPFIEVQAEIKERLRTEMLNKEYAEYVAKLRERTPVVTVFDQAGPAGRTAQPNRNSTATPR